MEIGDTFTMAGVHEPPRSRWMRLLIRLRLMKPPTDTPLSQFRVTMTAAERSALLLEKLEEDRLDALRDGKATLHDLTNCAYGTWGYMIGTLRRDGLMSVEHEPAADGFMLWRYAITEKGRAYLQAADAPLR